MKLKLRKLDHTGDTCVEFDPAVENEAKKLAQQMFDDAVKGSRAVAFAFDSPNEGRQIRSLDEAKDAKEVILQRPIVGG